MTYSQICKALENQGTIICQLYLNQTYKLYNRNEWAACNLDTYFMRVVTVYQCQQRQENQKEYFNKSKNIVGRILLVRSSTCGYSYQRWHLCQNRGYSHVCNFLELLSSGVTSFIDLKTCTHTHREIRQAYYGNKHTYTQKKHSVATLC